MKLPQFINKKVNLARGKWWIAVELRLTVSRLNVPIKCNEVIRREYASENRYDGLLDVLDLFDTGFHRTENLPKNLTTNFVALRNAAFVA